MKKKLVFAVIGMVSVAFVMAQSSPQQKNYRNFPLILAVQFHNISMPFSDMGSNFSNIGFRAGTEVSLNGKQNWAQGFSASWHYNKYAGNGLMLYTETIYRPTIIRRFFAEVKAGAGISHSFHPTDGYKLEDGEWINEGREGKTMLVVPVSIGFGYNGYKQGLYLSPFISYGLLLQKDYNKILPVAPNTVFQIGTRIHF